MIKEIKYQRCRQKFNTLLNDIVECPIHNCIWYHYPISSINKWCLFIEDIDLKEFKLLYYKINILDMCCGLDKEDIIKIINDRFNKNNYKLVISD